MKEMKIFNVSVTGFEESLLASGYPMSKNDVYQYGGSVASKTLFYSPYNKTIYETHTYDEPAMAVKKISKVASSLANAKQGSGHDCFLKGITVSFDISYPVYWSPQFQRYHFADIVSST